MKPLVKPDYSKYMRRSPSAGTVAGVAAVGFVAGFAAYQAKKMAVQGLTSAKGDWTETIKAEHRMVEAVFDKLLATKRQEKVKRATLLTAIAHLLGKHALEEENVIYPALRGGDHEAKAKHLFSDHADIKTFIHELEELPKDDEAWLPKATAFATLVKTHAAEEETFFPTFKASLTPKQNSKLAAQIYREGVKLA
jgi:hemerythrin superfamily protein